MTDGTDQTSQGPSSEEIESALNRTGFLLEHRVAKSLRDYRLAPRVTPEVTVGDAYPDSESGKSREIDVYAEFYDFVKRDPEISVHICVTLIVECKNSSGPFVLIGDHGAESPYVRDFAFTSFDPFSLGFTEAKYESLESKLQLSQLSGFPTRHDFTGRQLLRLNRQAGGWRADNSSIYDSILYPLAKARQYKVEAFKRENQTHEYESWALPTIRYIIPIVVTSGQLYTVDATDDDLKISPAKWANIRRSFSSNDLKGHFWADVVSFKGWGEYLDAKIAKIFKSLRDSVTKHIHLYDPEWMIAHYGQPTDEEFFQEWLDNHLAERNRAAQKSPSKG